MTILLDIARAYADMQAEYDRLEADEASWTREAESLRLIALNAAARAAVKGMIEWGLDADGVASEDENGRLTATIHECVNFYDDARVMHHADDLSKMIISIFASEPDRADKIAPLAVKHWVAPAVLGARPHNVV